MFHGAKNNTQPVRLKAVACFLWFYYMFIPDVLQPLIFALIGTIMILLWEKGYTAIYTDISKYGWWWLLASLILSMLIDETYYYWMHRLLHKPKLFKLIHKVHHPSNITSPWTAFSFHPLEGLLLSVSLPVILMMVPLEK